MHRTPTFAISMMCMDMLSLRPQLLSLNQRAHLYHVDIMDGHFAPNITLSPDFIRSVSSLATLPIEAHLMTTNPDRWIDAVAQAGASIISPHAETINVHAFRTFSHIRSLGCQTGVTLNPATPLSEVEYYLDCIDLLTLMTVDVGYAGQAFIEPMLRKIEQAREWKEKHAYPYRIQVDGACNAHTYRRLWDAGAEVFVMGSSGLFSLNSDIEAAYDRMLTDFGNATGVKL